MESELNEYERKDKLFDKAEAIRVAMLTTEDEKGNLVSRPMHTSEIDRVNHELWFFTQEWSSKARDIKNTHLVNVAYSEPNDQCYLSISGEAEIVTDKNIIQSKWSPILKAWFPGGVNQPGVSLLKVKLQRAEYWDASANKMVQFYYVAKALVTGEQYREGEHANLTF
ncbi:MAG: pyridoxamine 5'-phosphate oxidase family protein [Bacteroidota bacterium]